MTEQQKYIVKGNDKADKLAEVGAMEDGAVITECVAKTVPWYRQVMIAQLSVRQMFVLECWVSETLEKVDEAEMQR